MSGQSIRRKLRVSTTIPVSVGCSCRRQSKPKSKPKPELKSSPEENNQTFGNPSSWNKSRPWAPRHGDDDEMTTTATAGTSFSPSSSQCNSDSEGVDLLFVGTVAVEKESSEPYIDFRRSMMQMIVQKKIYDEEGLKELVKCFLRLNSPIHHQVIIRAFIHISNLLFCFSDHASPALAL